MHLYKSNLYFPDLINFQHNTNKFKYALYFCNMKPKGFDSSLIKFEYVCPEKEVILR